MSKILGLLFWSSLLLLLYSATPSSWFALSVAAVLCILWGMMRAGWWLLSPPQSRR